jgi:hypothetical protein
MIRKLVLLGFLAIMVLDGQQKKTSPGKRLATPKPTAQVEVYDPDNLGPGEIACGRLTSKKSPMCECMKHRVKEADKAREVCHLITDRTKRIECAMSADACQVKVVDAEAAAYSEDMSEQMPAQCKRTCRKARCECCHS